MLYELITYFITLFLIGLVYIVFTPVINMMNPYLTQYNVPSELINLLTFVWNNWVLLVIGVLTLWLFVRALRKEPEEQYIS